MSNKLSNLKLIIVFVFISFLCPTKILAQVKINEFLPNSSTEWIEFYNASASADFLKTYYVDDDTDFNSDIGSSGKRLLSSLDISNIPFPFIEISSFLNNGGDWVVLFDSSGVLLDSFQYQSDPGQDVSMGRSPDETGAFSILDSLTKGAPNSSPLETETPEPTNEPTDDPTSSPTSSPTKTPTAIPTPTKTPTPKPTKTPTPEPTEEVEFEEAVLGIQNEIVSPTPQGELQEESGKPKVSILAIVFVILGISFVGFSGFAFFKQKGLNNNESGKDKEII